MDEEGTGTGIDINFGDDKSVIKVIGVGGGGGNAVNYMFRQGICNVDFVICNTDKHALNKSPIPFKIQLGEKGLGAGNKPDIGRQAANESLPKIQKMLEGTEMVFITAGMGGGTGTGAAPVIAQAAKDMDILTIGIITIPFLFEGPNRVYQALDGVEEMRKHVDAILIINNERIKELYGDLTLRNAFSKADNVLTIAAKGIAEIITVPGYVNVDLNDVRTVMTDSGEAIMGAGKAAGVNRAMEAIRNSLDSPLLLSTDISGAKDILINISSGEDEVTMDEIDIITGHLKKIVGPGTQIIWGATFDETLGEDLNITIVATGFNINTREIIDRMSSKADPPVSQVTEKPPVQEQPQAPEKKRADLGFYYGKRTPDKTPFRTRYSETSPSPGYDEGGVDTAEIDLDDEENIERMEKTPAFHRQQEKPSNKNSGQYSQDDISYFSIGKEDNEFKLKSKNNYLHNNVD